MLSLESLRQIRGHEHLLEPLQKYRLGLGQFLLTVPEQVDIHVNDSLPWRQARDLFSQHISCNDVFRQAINAITSAHQPAHFIQARRRGNDAPGEPLLITEHRERGLVAADLVAGKTDEVSAPQIRQGQVLSTVQPVPLAAEN